MALAKSNALVTAATQQAIEADAAVSIAGLAKTQFVKITDNGKVATDIDAAWECVHDISNRLTWEVKKNDGGIRDRDNTYSWQQGANDRYSGVSDGGRCTGGIDCDTSSYVRAMNEQRLCGYSDWRLPSREELETLVAHNNDTKQASIDTGHFPQAVPSWYWTASENPGDHNYAWYVLFRNGIALNDLKERPKHIRLVRSALMQ